MLDKAFRFTPLDDADTWQLAEGHGEHVYRKEVFYVGDFLMQDGEGNRFPSAVTEEFIDELVATGTQMLSDGIDIPVPIEHTNSPEKKRGHVVKLAKEIDSKGRVGFFNYVKFRDADSAKAFANSDVSAYITPKFTSGNGKTYHRPLRHLALTDYPVIPALDRFEAISLSLSSGASNMPLKSLAKRLGITLEDGDDDAAIQKKIVTAYKAKGKPAPKEAKLSDPPADPPNDPKKEPAKQPETKKVSPLLLSSIKDSRSAKLEKLVAERRITPSQRDVILSDYCTDEGITLALSDTAVDDGFDGLLNVLAKNEPYLKSGEHSGPQVLELGISDQQGEKNPLIADMEKRAKSA
jgi:hypothetical protein